MEEKTLKDQIAEDIVNYINSQDPQRYWIPSDFAKLISRDILLKYQIMEVQRLGL
jgi:hypothetical protein